MPLIYGEGMKNAFCRLREEIEKRSSVDVPMPLPNGTSLENGMYTMLFHTSRPSEDGALTDI